MFAIVSQKEEEISFKKKKKKRPTCLKTLANSPSLQTPTSMVILRSFPTVGDDTTLQQFLLGACTQGS